MTLSRPVICIVTALALAAPLRAQPAGGAANESVYAQRPGSLTIFSKPTGAVFTLEGTQIQLAGRTPWSVARGLSGVFTIRADNKGYEGWSRTMFLDPTASDTLRIELSPKTAFKAFARSLVVPGWGQSYRDQGFKGALFFTATLGGGVTFLVLQHDYQNARDDAEAAYDAYVAEDDLVRKNELRAALDRKLEEADDADRHRDIAAIATASVYGVNLLDTLLFGPRSPHGFLASVPDRTGLLASATPGNTRLGWQWVFE